MLTASTSSSHVTMQRTRVINGLQRLEYRTAQNRRAAPRAARPAETTSQLGPPIIDPCKTSCAGGRHNMPPTSWPLTFWPWISESRVTWPTFVPILVFLGLSISDLGPMYATDRQDVRRASSLNASTLWGRGYNNRWQYAVMSVHFIATLRCAQGFLYS